MTATSQTALTTRIQGVGVAGFKENTGPGISQLLHDMRDSTVATVNSVADLRTALAAGVAPAAYHVRYHTTLGYGGGTYIVDPTDTTSVDNGGTIIVGGLLRAHIAPTVVVTADTFGAVPDYDWVNGVVHTNSTAAILAYCEWISGTPTTQVVGGHLTRYANEETAQARPFRLGKGWYYIDQTIPLRSYYNVRGEGKTVTHIWWGGATNSWPFEIGSDGAYEYVWGLRLSDLEIAGGAACGAAAVRVFAQLLDFKIDINIGGGFTKAFLVAEGTDTLVGVQWGELRLSDLPRPGTAHLPANMLWCETFINACYVELQTRGLTGASCTLRNGGGGNYSVFTGTSQGDHIGFDVAPGNSQTSCAGMRVVDWKEEANAVPSYFEGAARLELTGGGLDNKVQLSGCRDTRVINHLGSVDEGDSIGTRYIGGLESGTGVVERDNASGSTDSLLRDYAQGGVANAAGFGVSDPENIWPFGDFERGPSAYGTMPGLDQYTPVITTQCGIGLSDTTHSTQSRRCYKVAPDGSNAITLYFKLTGPLPPYLAGCYFSASFRVKTAQSVASITYGAHVLGGNPLTYSSSGGTITGSDGWSLLSGTYLISADMCTNGIEFGIAAPNTHTFYLAECQASFGCVVPRVFVPAKRALYIPHGSIEMGRISILVDSVDDLAADPGTGVGYNNGDRGILRSPVVETSSGGLTYVTEGWDRIGGAWVPRQYLTGLEPS